MEDVMTVQCFPLSEVDDGLVPHRRNPGHGTALPEGTVNLHYSRREAETWLSTRQVGSGSPLIRKRWRSDRANHYHLLKQAVPNSPLLVWVLSCPNLPAFLTIGRVAQERFCCVSHSTSFSQRNPILLLPKSGVNDGATRRLKPRPRNTNAKPPPTMHLTTFIHARPLRWSLTSC